MSEAFYIVRDADKHGDVATVWNYKLGGWCWDVDAYYTKSDGFAYKDKRSAEDKAKSIRRGYTKHTNVRVVNREELFELRELKDHSRRAY